MEKLLDNLNLSVEEDDELLIDVEGVEDREGGIFLCLVGRFLTDQNVNFNIIQRVAWKTFMRIRVELDVSQPLKRFKKIHLGSGSSTVVIFKYEWLNVFCSVCDRLGHSKSFCDDLFNSPDGVVNKKWGLFIRAPERRGSTRGGGNWLRSACN
ncbi:hypothetical protein ACS0TY_024816 [Phlomoides rotata]